MSEPVEIPADMAEQVQELCLALPEVTVRVDESRRSTRSTAYSYDIRRRSFCLLVAVADPAGVVVPVLVLRAAADERAALLSGGDPYFPPRGGRDRVGLVLGDTTDWQEVRELIIESYCKLAPKKLCAVLDTPTPPVEHLDA